MPACCLTEIPQADLMLFIFCLQLDCQKEWAKRL